MASRRASRPPRQSRVVSGRAQMAQHAPQMAPRRPQGGSTCLPDGPKTAPRWPQDSPRATEDTRRKLQKASQDARRGPKHRYCEGLSKILAFRLFGFPTLQEAHESPKTAPKLPSRSPQKAPKSFQEAPRGPQEVHEAPGRRPRGPKNTTTMPLRIPKVVPKRPPRGLGVPEGPTQKHIFSHRFPRVPPPSALRTSDSRRQPNRVPILLKHIPQPFL